MPLPDGLGFPACSSFPERAPVRLSFPAVDDPGKDVVKGAMKMLCASFWSGLRRCAVPSVWVAVLLMPASSARAQSPVVELGFSEFTGIVTTNSGSLGGTGSFVQADGRPIFINRVPVGAFVPAGNLSSVDFGDITAGQGGRAIDFIAQTGDGSVGSLTAFTVCGWLNARNLSEGSSGNALETRLQ